MTTWDHNQYKQANGVLVATATHSYYIAEASVDYRDGEFRLWAHVLTWAGGYSDDIRFFTSADGLTWADEGVAWADHCRAHVFWNEAANAYWAIGASGGAADQLDLATSANGSSFTTTNSNVMPLSESGWDSTQFGNVFMWKEGATWHLMYEANGDLGGTPRWRMGHATSANGTSWTKDPANPIVIAGFDLTQSNCVYGGAWVTKIGSTYYMLFHGKPASGTGEWPTDIYLASSTDLQEWTQVGDNAFLERSYVWEGYNNAQGQVADPFVLEKDGQTWLFYEGLPDQTHASDKPFRIGLALFNVGLTTLLGEPWAFDLTALQGGGPWAFDLDGVTNSALAVADSAHGLTSDAPALTQAHTLVAADTAHAHTAENAALAQTHHLLVADASHAQAADEVTLTVHVTALEVADAAHAQTADNVALTQAHSLVVADGAHGHTAENVALVNHGNSALVVADARSTQTADNVALTQHHTLVIADSRHTETAENVTLTVAALQLAVQDARHTHAAEAPTLTQVHHLTVSDSGHTQAADNVTIATAGSIALSIDDAFVALMSDVPVMAQLHRLAVNDAHHAHTGTMEPDDLARAAIAMTGEWDLGETLDAEWDINVSLTGTI